MGRKLSHNAPDVSVIIPWCDRPELRETLLHNQPAFEDVATEVVVANCGGQQPQLRQTLANLPCAVRCVTIPCQKFNKCLALNIGVCVSSGALLFLLDADVKLSRHALREMVSEIDRRCFVTVSRVHESAADNELISSSVRELAHYVEIVDDNGERHVLETNRIFMAEGARSAPGLVLVWRDHFLQIDGMNGALSGWGWEDLDLIFRLQLQVRLQREYAGAVIHLSHSDQLRNIGDVRRAESEMDNFRHCLANYSVRDFGGTYSRDVQEWRDRVSQSVHLPSHER